jgi:flagellar basal body-associated protein FliL
MAAPLLPMTGAQPEAPAADKEKTSKKSKKKRFVILGLVILLGGGGAYETVLKPKPVVAKDKNGKPIPAKVEGGETIKLDPVTTSIADGHVIQISLGLRLVKGADATLIATEAPQADDAALQVLAGYTYKVLLSPAGREKVRTQIKKAVIKEVVDDKGKQQIFDVFLPTYVLQ